MGELQKPYVTLGRHLKYVREQSDRSLAEVSGAVEIDERNLARIEAGEERPSEDILLLLISYFDVQDQEAVQLWELANYDGDMPDQIKPDLESLLASKPVVMLMALDARTIYSDGADIGRTKAGVVMHFTQDSGKNQATVAKVGMSLPQAEEVLRQLHRAVMTAKYTTDRMLPPGGDK
jgi:transcriptional regulator with XRE-family HTH domain